MNRNRLEILLSLATALVLSGCGGAGEKAGGSSAGAAAPPSVNTASPAPAAGSGANVAPTDVSAVAAASPTTGGNAAQPGAAQGTGPRGGSNAPPAKMPEPQIGSGGNDLYLFTQVRGALNADAELKAANVILDVKAGVVTLSGAVASAERKSKAEQLARSVSGVRAVKSQLRVSGGN